MEKDVLTTMKTFSMSVPGTNEEQLSSYYSSIRTKILPIVICKSHTKTIGYNYNYI